MNTPGPLLSKSCPSLLSVGTAGQQVQCADGVSHDSTPSRYMRTSVQDHQCWLTWWLSKCCVLLCCCVRCLLTSVSSVTPRGCTRRRVQDSSKASQVRAAHESCATHVMVCSALLALGCVCILLWSNPSVGPTLHACPLVAHSSADIHRLARAVGQGVRTHAS